MRTFACKMFFRVRRREYRLLSGSEKRYYKKNYSGKAVSPFYLWFKEWKKKNTGISAQEKERKDNIEREKFKEKIKNKTLCQNTQ